MDEFFSNEKSKEKKELDEAATIDKELDEELEDFVPDINFEEALSRKFDDLFAATEEAAAEEAAPREEPSEFEKVKSLILTLDWEINEDLTRELLKEIRILEAKFAHRRTLASILKLTAEVLSDIVATGPTKARPGSFNLVMRAIEAAEKIASQEGEEPDWEELSNRLGKEWEDIKKGVAPSVKTAEKPSPPERAEEIKPAAVAKTEKRETPTLEHLARDLLECSSMTSAQGDLLRTIVTKLLNISRIPDYTTIDEWKALFNKLRESLLDFLRLHKLAEERLARLSAELSNNIGLPQEEIDKALKKEMEPGLSEGRSQLNEKELSKAKERRDMLFFHFGGVDYGIPTDKVDRRSKITYSSFITIKDKPRVKVKDKVYRLIHLPAKVDIAGEKYIILLKRAAGREKEEPALLADGIKGVKAAEFERVEEEGPDGLRIIGTFEGARLLDFEAA